MDVLERIRGWAHPPKTEPGLATDRRGDVPLPALRDAAVALLLEAAYGDTELADPERDAIRRGIEREFGVDPVEAAAFMDSALGARPPMRSLEALTAEVRDGYDREQRIALVALLWSVVRADDVVTAWERSFARHVAEAVGLSAEDWQRAKARAEAA